MGMTATRIRILETKKTGNLEDGLRFWTGKAAMLKLKGEHKTYKWEYDTCLEKIALFQRLLDKRQVARHLSSSTKASP